jgi:hypothetical protein
MDHILNLGNNLEVSGQLHAPATLLLGKETQYHWRGGWVGLTAGLDDMEK